jgi:Lon protease-like protein
MSAKSAYRVPSDLPRVVPVFPLTGAIVLPRWPLPLNIFEPRYLNMVDDALAGDRLIGMVQPRPDADAVARGPALQDVGCVARVMSFSETEDGRYLISLTGICRFRIQAELDIALPYRKVEADFEPFAADLSTVPALTHVDREELQEALAHYVDVNGFQADWSAVADAPAEVLVNALSTACPFDPHAKQALLEAPDVGARADLLIALLERYGSPPGDGGHALQ